MYICIIKQMQVMFFWIFNLEYSCKKKKLSMLLFIQNSINPIVLSTYPFIGSLTPSPSSCIVTDYGE